MTRKSKQEKYDAKKAATDKSAVKDKAAQDALRDKQNVNNPPKLTRKERELAKRMDEEPNPPKKS